MREDELRRQVEVGVNEGESLQADASSQLGKELKDEFCITYSNWRDNFKQRAVETLRVLALKRGIPTILCKDYWLEHNVLAYVYRNSHRKTNRQKAQSDMNKGEPSNSAVPGDQRPTVEGNEQPYKSRRTDEYCS
ncbi:hypothetical protein EDC96DRAFT_550153 [Choanephora cucurbitarum]|nr:hypothetical protein EDC96DRAFT_550153 [Choanephora cucurbitarum]